MNGCKSKIFDVISGVPKGSVLGPILFVIFINSLVDKAETANPFLYADDLKILKENVPKRTQRAYKKICISSTTGPDTRS